MGGQVSEGVPQYAVERLKQCKNVVALKLDQGVLDQEFVSDNGQQSAVRVLQGDGETVAGAAITRWTAQP